MERYKELGIEKNKWNENDKNAWSTFFSDCYIEGNIPEKLSYSARDILEGILNCGYSNWLKNLFKITAPLFSEKNHVPKLCDMAKISFQVLQDENIAREFLLQAETIAQGSPKELIRVAWCYKNIFSETDRLIMMVENILEIVRDSVNDQYYDVIDFIFNELGCKEWAKSDVKNSLKKFFNIETGMSERLFHARNIYEIFDDENWASTILDPYEFNYRSEDNWLDYINTIIFLTDELNDIYTAKNILNKSIDRYIDNVPELLNMAKCLTDSQGTSSEFVTHTVRIAIRAAEKDLNLMLSISVFIRNELKNDIWADQLEKRYNL